MISKYNGKVNKYDCKKKNQETGNNKNYQNKMGEYKFHYHVRNSNSKLWEIEEKIGNSREMAD